VYVFDSHVEAVEAIERQRHHCQPWCAVVHQADVYIKSRVAITGRGFYRSLSCSSLH